MSWGLPGRKSIETGQVSLQLKESIVRNDVAGK